MPNNQKYLEWGAPILSSLIVLALGIFIAGCGGGGGIGDVGSVDSVIITDPYASTDPYANNKDYGVGDPIIPASLNALSGVTVSPSKINVLFQVFDEYGNTKPGLNKSDFTIKVGTIDTEGNIPDITNDAESFVDIKTITGLGFSMPTVFVLDISSSITNANLLSAVEGIRGLLLNADNTSKLLPQQKVALVIFDGDVTTHLGFTRSAANIKAALDSLANLNRQTTRADNGSTNLYGAAQTALGLWNNSSTTNNITEGYMVIIGDGADTSQKVTKKTVVDEIIASKKRVFTIPTTGITAQGISDLSSLASDPGYVSQTIDFSALGAELQAVSTNIIDMLDSIYLMESVTSARNGIQNIELIYSNTAYPPKITGTFDASGFSGTDRELRINNATIDVSGNLMNTVMNIPLGTTVDLYASTKWTINPGSYTWANNNPARISVTPSGTNSEKLSVLGSAIGLATITVTDSANSSFTTQTNVSDTFNIYISNVEASVSTLQTTAGGVVEVSALDTVDPYATFTWNSNNPNCTFTNSFTNTTTVNITNGVNPGICILTVASNTGGTYALPLSYGTNGTAITNLTTVTENIMDIDFTFFSKPTDPMLATWLYSNSNYIYTDDTNSFEFESSTTTRVTFDYYFSATNNASEKMTFSIDGTAVFSDDANYSLTSWKSYDSGPLSAGKHTFKLTYDAATISDLFGIDNLNFE